MARPLVEVQLIDDKKLITLPAVFTAPIRTDIVQYVHTNMNKNKRQAYAVHREAGMQHSALSWGTGRAVSRIPRVKGSGTRRSGQAAFGNMCRGGRMFAPTKTWRKWHRKISKGQRRYATCSALAATAVPALVKARGHRISTVDEIPLVVANDVMYSIEKTKEAVEVLAKIGADGDVERVKESKKVRVGRGKARGRKYVKRTGPLIVYGREDSRITQVFRNIPGVELCNVTRLNLLQLAPGGHIGRFVIWTEDAFEQLDSVFGTYETASEQKTGFKLPSPIMANTDVTGIINSDEIQSVLKPKQRQGKFTVRKKNPLTNLGAMVKLNPYVLTQRRRAAQQQETATKTRATLKMADTYKDFLFGQ